MYTVTIRFNGAQFVAELDNPEIDGMGETIPEALRDLADNMEALQL